MTAEAMLDRMRPQLADLAEERWTSIMITRLAEAALMICRGEWAQAIELLPECQADACQHGDRQYLMSTDADLAIALMESGILGDGSTVGAWEEAETALKEAVSLAVHLHTSTENPTLWRCYLVRLLAVQGQLKEARSLLVESRSARAAAGLVYDRLRASIRDPGRGSTMSLPPTANLAMVLAAVRGMYDSDSAGEAMVVNPDTRAKTAVRYLPRMAMR